MNKKIEITDTKYIKTASTCSNETGSIFKVVFALIVQSNNVLKPIRDFLGYCFLIAITVAIINHGMYLQKIERKDLLIESVISFTGLTFLLGMSILLIVCFSIIVFTPSIFTTMYAINLQSFYKNRQLFWLMAPSSILAIILLGIVIYFELPFTLNHKAIQIYLFISAFILFRIGYCSKMHVKIPLKAASKTKWQLPIKYQLIIFKSLALLAPIPISILSIWALPYIIQLTTLTESISLISVIAICCFIFVGFMPPLIYLFSRSEQVSHIKSLKYSFFLPIAILIGICTFLLPTKFSSTIYNNFGIFSDTPLQFRLQNHEAISNANLAKIDVDKNQTITVYKRYVFGNIFWLCKYPYDPDKSKEENIELAQALEKKKNLKSTKEELSKINIMKGCVEFDKKDLTFLL